MGPEDDPLAVAVKKPVRLMFPVTAVKSIGVPSMVTLEVIVTSEPDCTATNLEGIFQPNWPSTVKLSWPV